MNQRVFIFNIKLFYGSFFSDFEILFSVWGVIFLILVIIISSMVIIFSFSYMRGIQVRNFIFLYLSFIFRMLWLVVNNSFYWIILGWDGLGVVSFLLIVFYINCERINNGLFTLFQNRIGDLFFVLFIIGVLSIEIWRRSIVKWGLVFLIFGGCVKSAQFPFNAWLLSAIRAPTPISSLVHSSTLVVAGVYVLLQFRYCLIDVLSLLKFIALLRLILRIFGLMNERDIKKLIAYSTIRHVSLIIYFLRFGLFKIVYFHLNIHAIFKSLIFICFGFLMLRSYHSQDKRIVSMKNLNPVIKIVYYFSCLCLAGLPFLRGFFSKDLIIEKLIENRLEFSFILSLLLFLRVRIYYRIKLARLSNVIFSYGIVEKRTLGMVRILLIRFIIIGLINIYLSLIFRLRLEFFSFKVAVYMFIFGFFLLRILTRLNYKISIYDKIQNFKETWFLDFYSIDKFVYWNIFLFLNYAGFVNNFKLILLINWWVFILFVVIFYNRSFKSVALKKLSD